MPVQNDRPAGRSLTDKGLTTDRERDCDQLNSRILEMEHAMRPKTEIEIFVSSWVTQNIRFVSAVANLPEEVDRLAACLTGDARARGISGSDLNRTVGDIDDYLTEQYYRAFGSAFLSR
jgi:hypothetical protein